MSNASRAHAWLPQRDIVPVVVEATLDGLTEGADRVHDAIDGDLRTFYQPPLGGSGEGGRKSNLTFDLQRRYQLNKLKVQCAVVPRAINFTGRSGRVVTLPPSIPINSTHIQSLDLYTRDHDPLGENGGTEWKLAQRFRKTPCVFDTATNATSYQVLMLDSPVQFARYVSIVVTSTVSGAAPRIAEVNFFGGVAPVLMDSRDAALGQSTDATSSGIRAANDLRRRAISRASTNGTVVFDSLLISDHLAQSPYYLDPLVAGRRLEDGAADAKNTDVAGLFALDFFYDTGECVQYVTAISKRVVGTCVRSRFRAQEIVGGGSDGDGGLRCDECTSAQQVAMVRSDWFRVASSAARLQLTAAPSDGNALSVLRPAPSVLILDAMGTIVRHSDSERVSKAGSDGCGPGFRASSTAPSNSTSASEEDVSNPSSDCSFVGAHKVTAAIVRQHEDGSPAQLLHTSVRQACQGAVQFPELRVTTTGKYVVQVSLGGLAPDTSLPFTISHGRFERMAVTEQPSGAIGGISLKQQPIVTLQDAAGNTVTSKKAISVGVDLIDIQASDISRDAGSPGIFASQGALSAPARPAVSLFGVAAFSNISVARTGTYSLKFFTFPDRAQDVGNATVVSEQFAVVAGSAERLALKTMVSGCRIQTACVTQPVVIVTDLGGNEVPWPNGGHVAVALVRHPPPRTLLGSLQGNTAGWTAPLDALGRASLRGIAGDTTGDFVLHVWHIPRSQATDILRPTLSPVFAVTTSAARLVVTQQPEGDFWFAQSGKQLLQQPIVTVVGSNSHVLDLDDSWYMSASPANATQNKHLLHGTTVVSAGNGTAKFTDLKIDVAGACYSLWFSLGQIRVKDRRSTAVVFVPSTAHLRVLSAPFEVSIGEPWQIVLVREPAGVITGQIIQTQPIVHIADAAGNVMVYDSRSTVTASLINAPAHSAFDPDLGLTGSPDSSVKIDIVDRGVANFEGLIVKAASSCIQLRFSRLGLRSADSIHFQTVAGPPSELMIAKGFEPSVPTPGSVLDVQPWATLHDKYGNLCIGNGDDNENFGSVSADISVLPAQEWLGLGYTKDSWIFRGVLLLGTTTQLVQQGGARFTDLRIDKAGVYQLVFHWVRPDSTPLQVVSAKMTVVTGAASRLWCTHIPDGMRAGAVFQRPPIVAIHDDGKNLVGLSNVAVSMYLIESSQYSSLVTSNLREDISSSSGSMWSDVCASYYRGHMWVQGERKVNLSSTTATTSGLAIFPGINVSLASTNVRKPQTTLCISRSKSAMCA